MMINVFLPSADPPFIGGGPYGTRQDRVFFWMAFVLAFALGIAVACII